MTMHYLYILGSMAGALLAGSLVGLERSYHGRPAGFRTHALVCLSAAVLMLFTTNQIDWLVRTDIGPIETDPTRMAAGIMSGIGFLGAGVIFKEGLTVRGLTTAASIWMTAALGILYGIAWFLPAVAATLATLAVLGIFRLIEYRIPTQVHVRHVLRVPNESSLDEVTIRDFLRLHGFEIATISYHLSDKGRTFEYDMVIRTFKPTALRQLAVALREREDILDFSLTPLAS